MKQNLHILFLFLALSNLAYAQENLVPNPSFEEYYTCPSGWATFDINNWFRTNGSPDYYNSCDNSIPSWSGVPSNQTGFQYAKDGNGYVGIATFQGGASDLREFVGVELLSPLEKEKVYYVSMYVALSTNEFNEETFLGCATNRIGFRFTNVIGDNGSGGKLIPVNNVAHVYCDTIISDTLNWTRVSGSFVADSAYHYLTIGNHFDDDSTIVICTGVQQNSNAYYYIDMVWVSEDSNTVGFDEIFTDKEIAQIYPNPVNSTIYLNKRGVKDYTIIDAFGKMVQSENNNSTNQINVENIPNGVYFLIINNQYVKKVSIIH